MGVTINNLATALDIIIEYVFIAHTPLLFLLLSLFLHLADYYWVQQFT